jgi:hypothetical protein
LRVDPTRAGVDGQYGVAVVVLAGEEPRHLLLLEHPLDPEQLLLDFGEQVPVLLGQLEELLGVCEARLETVEEFDPTLHAREAGRYGLGLLGIVPETGLAHLLAQLLGLATQAPHVEESLELGEATFQLGGLVPRLRH